MFKYRSLVYFTIISFVFLSGTTLLSAKETKNNQVDCIQINVDVLSELGEANSQQAVSVLQKYLRQMKYLKSGPSGYYGQLTQNAVKIFQKNNGIIPTGNVDLSTRNKIKSLSCGNVISTKNQSNILMVYSNFDFGFSISYPKSAYMKTQCGTNTKDELVPLEVTTENNMFRIGYTKKLEDCQLVKNNSNGNIKFGDSGIIFQIYQAKSSDEFIKKIYGSKCIIDTEKSDSTLRFTQPIQSIKIKKSDSIKECIDNNSCPNERFTCADPKMYFYDPVVKKGVAIQYSNADYYIQKYPTYVETMKKGSYDTEIIQSFKFFHNVNNDTGKITLSGKILTWGNGPICFRPNKEDVEKIPKDNDGFTNGWFCFSQDENYIMDKFGLNSKLRINGLDLYEVGTAKIVISEYTLFRKEAMGADSAKLDQIINKNIYKEAVLENNK